MTRVSPSKGHGLRWLARIVVCAPVLCIPPLSALAQSNSCPVDGCQVAIRSAQRADDGEITIELSANYNPQLTKNHVHVWWGEHWDVTQVTADAQNRYQTLQGVYHPIDDYPVYTTKGVVSIVHRFDATSLCVTAADRSHNILDPRLYHCVSIAALLDDSDGPGRATQSGEAVGD